MQVLDRLDLTDFTVQSVLLSGLPQGLASTVCPGHREIFVPSFRDMITVYRSGLNLPLASAWQSPQLPPFPVLCSLRLSSCFLVSFPGMPLQRGQAAVRLRDLQVLGGTSCSCPCC